MFGVALPEAANFSGAWGKFWQPIFATQSSPPQVGLSLSMAICRHKKNLGALISLTAALMLGTQFWHAHSGGLALPGTCRFAIGLTVFRPKLEDRVAVAVVR